MESEASEAGAPRPAGDAAEGAEAVVARLAAVLGAAAGTDVSVEAGPTPRELAELLWFAEQLGAAGEGSSPGRPAAPGPAHRDTTDAPAPPDPAHPAVPPQSEPDPPHPSPDDRVPLHLPQPPRPGPRGPNGGGTPLLAPAPPMLPRPLALQRALRLLKRKVPSPHARLLDEHATADRIARLGAHPDVWFPVLRPAPDRWLRLNLVYDAGPTMPVWRPLVRELHTLLAQSGIFRTVSAHRATPDGRAHQVPALADGRTVTLIVSDCMGPQWRPGPAGDRWYRTLHRWASRMPLAVVQPLPEHLWPTTALPAAPGLLTAPAAAAPSAALTFTPYEAAPDASDRAVPLPVLEPAPAWLANWASLVASPGGSHAPGALAWLPPSPAPPAEPAPDIASLPAQDLVLRFRATASPEAFRIAGHLALADPSLPVMRLVQRALDRSPRPQHLAEVILSGMLTAVPGPPGSYEFRAGVRELLLRSLPRTARTRTREFLARVGGLIDERAAVTPGEFRVEARGDRSGGVGPAFATVSAETVARLGGDPAAEGGLVGGRYRLLGQRGPSQRMWAAVDVRTERPVVVHLYPPQKAPQERFLREARALAGLRHPNVVRVLDYGVADGRPYVVAEFVDGVTLAELQNGSGPGVSFRVYAQLVADVVPALEALHKRGLVRGQESWDGLLLRPDGTVMISRFALGEQSEGHDERSDFLLFGSLLRALASHSPAGPDFRRMQAELARGEDPADAVRRLPRSAAFARALAGTEADRLRITVLGPLNIRRAGRFLALPSPEAQALLCLLLLHQGRRVGLDTLAEGLWEHPPSGVEATRRLHEVATDIRQCLGPGTLAELADGYAVHLPGDYVDVHHCEELVTDRTSDLALATQRSLIQDALSLFYSDPLLGIPGPAAKATRARLRALRLSLYATRAELDLELGHFEQATADLTALVRDHPDREDFRRLHIEALRRTGRVAAAIEAYEAYEEYRERQYSEPIEPALQELYHELRAAPRPTIALEAADLSEHPQAHRALGRAADRLLSTALRPDQYEMLARDNGYVVLTEPGTAVLPVVSAALLQLPVALAELDDPPRFRVTFWDTPWFAGTDESAIPSDVRAALESIAADVTVVVSPELHAEFSGGGAFLPLHGGTPGSPPLAWYCPLSFRAAEPRSAPRDLVRGPFTTPDLALLSSDPGRTAIVHTQPDGPLTVLDPARPWGRRRPLDVTYYEVDLTTHRASHQVVLPSSGGGTFAASVELSWHVAAPVAFVRGEATHVGNDLLDHFLSEAFRITRRYPLSRAGAAQQAVEAGMSRWPVPGLSVTCSVRLAPGAPPTPAPPQPSSGPPAPLADLLHPAQYVLLGFEGPLTRPFSTKAARSAALDLLSLVVDHRDPEDALAGRPLTGDGPVPLQEELVHPLDVLRAFADSGIAPLLRDRLDRLELRAVTEAHPTPHVADLVHALHDSGRGVAVVTNFCEQAVHRHLDFRGLPLTAVFGRDRQLMPDPQCLRRALNHFGRSATGLLISSTAAEVTAARHLGLPVLGYADSPATERRLRTAGCDVTVHSLQPLLDAARSL
ncbi:SAV_2336 N-terminal domain-related protein [Streptomyces curacoi]|uniref:SAV_2336 N-terminal domain-related protein n=1 Tax=Streptomyces curacoi TaxID=146536 RepID=UPI00099EF5C3|nr:SAV_2336 N-terminal domain-related protein [Streptomyces curacoi]